MMKLFLIVCMVSVITLVAWSINTTESAKEECHKMGGHPIANRSGKVTCFASDSVLNKKGL